MHFQFFIAETGTNIVVEKDSNGMDDLIIGHFYLLAMEVSFSLSISFFLRLKT